MSHRASKADADSANREIINFAMREGLDTDDDCNGKLMAPLGGPLRGCWLTWGHNDPTSRLFFCVVTREQSTLSHGHETPDAAHIAAIERVRPKPREASDDTIHPVPSESAHPSAGMGLTEWEMRCALANAGWGALQWLATDAPEGTLRARLEGDHILTARARSSNPWLMIEIEPPCSGWPSVHCNTPAAALNVVLQWERQHSERARASAEAADILRAMLGGNA